MEILSSLSNITSPLILGIIIVGVIAMYRTGTLQYLLSKNGNGNNEISELKEQITMLGDNHLHELSEKLDKIIEQNSEHLQYEKENSFYLKQLINKK